ncbi:NADH-ubiquinone oxidoreductase-F iron-sulfur binding region domain-containing protein [Lacrimispora defluvii]|uniref:Iron reductase subunit beta n=1 Tax=Lacrimispora defluvii TaxID=2719233 RepID=A0ABX1VWX4_9FIRM|nr:NADH-ubiquinone oxidoreductase-F iron-sulfur binding region domain-containing protein [Lacrimispora defluvii]NNJ31895.1 iron reductase subunit beta [Lacrimispora defluvii]
MSDRRDDVMRVLSANHLKDYGVKGPSLAESFARRQASCLVVGLRNSDKSGVLLQLLDTQEGVNQLITGMESAALLLGAEKKILFIPEYAIHVKERIETFVSAAGIEVRIGLIDVREHEDSVICHLVTMLEIAECLEGTYEESIYVSVNGGSLKRVSPDTSVGDLIGRKEGKGVLIGNRIYDNHALEMNLEEIELDNGMVQILGENDCMIRLVEKDLLENRKRSCGKCVFCREGLLQLHAMYKDTAEGKGKNHYPELIREIGLAMKHGCLCSLGQNGAQPALGVLEHFSEEYMAHNKRKKCPAGVCFLKSVIYIDPVLCTGCMECLDRCPAGCIEGRPGYIHMIDSTECTGCRACIELCESKAVMETEGKLPKLPERLVKCGKFKKR